MSEFMVKVYKVAIDPHPNADAIEVARIGEFRSIVRKGQFKDGDLAAYIPEAAILPDGLIAELGLTGKLAGPQHNRVKAIRLRGLVSQGLVYPACAHWSEGDDVTAELSIVKYVPPIPIALAGQCTAVAAKWCPRFDIENWKRYPHTFAVGDPVVMTEKIHGTFCAMAILPGPFDEIGDTLVGSKGLLSQGLCFKLNEANAGNLYVRTMRANLEALRLLWSTTCPEGQALYVLGEIYGKGVQDLTYGATATGFRVFDVALAENGAGNIRFLSRELVERLCAKVGLDPAPVVYRGLFSREALMTATTGRETVTGRAVHIREGVVIRPEVEARNNEIGRVQLKSVSDDYLMRSGDATEFE